MKIAIMQPTFMPWAGYFALINYVDKFVFLNGPNLPGPVSICSPQEIRTSKIKRKKRCIALPCDMNSSKRRSTNII